MNVLKWIAILIVYILLVVVPYLVYMDSVYAVEPKTPVPAASAHFLDKEASEACSERSIGLSKKWRKERGVDALQAKNSMLTDPQIRILATLLFFEANKGYEDLVMNCAIWRRLGGGSL